MGAGIELNDSGYVNGSTWHGLSQYKQLDRPPLLEEALQVFAFDIDMIPVFAGDGTLIPNNYAFQRNDDKSIIDTKCVTEDYSPIQHREMVKMVQSLIIEKNPGVLEYDSVGTLNGGQVGFVNMKALQFQVNGDSSPTMTHLMLSNCFGKESASVMCHTTRVVCQNTHRLAEVQGVANKTFRKFRHIGGITSKIEESVIDLTELMTGLKLHVERMNKMADTEMSDTEATHFIKALFPDFKEKTSLVCNEDMVAIRRKELADIFIKGERGTLTEKASKSRYGMWQAVTYMADHPEESFRRKRVTSINRLFNGVSGKMDDFKQQAWDLLKV
jgi:phage/plasmid-like protein (TIGR03299 family)